MLGAQRERTELLRVGEGEEVKSGRVLASLLSTRREESVNDEVYSVDYVGVARPGPVIRQSALRGGGRATTRQQRGLVRGLWVKSQRRQRSVGVLGECILLLLVTASNGHSRPVSLQQASATT